MSEQEKREAIKEFFFAPIPSRSVRSIVIGFFFAYGGLMMTLGNNPNASAGSTFALLVCGVFWAVVMPLNPKDEPGVDQGKRFSVLQYQAAKTRYEKRPTVEKMREWLKEDITRIVEGTTEQLNIAEVTHDPIYVYGPLYFDKVDGVDNTLVLRRYVDGTYFYSTYRFSVFCFADKFLGVYQTNYNMIKNICVSEETDEFYYKDIVAVRTQTKSSNYSLKSGEKLEESKTFTLSVSSGESVSVILNDPEIKIGAEIESRGDQAVSNIRAMLRPYKELG